MPAPKRAPKDLSFDHNIPEAVRMALACLECPTPAPCQMTCSQNVNIPKVMYWVSMAACEGLVFSRWLAAEEEIEETWITE